MARLVDPDITVPKYKLKGMDMYDALSIFLVGDSIAKNPPKEKKELLEDLEGIVSPSIDELKAKNVNSAENLLKNNFFTFMFKAYKLEINGDEALGTLISYFSRRALSEDIDLKTLYELPFLNSTDLSYSVRSAVYVLLTNDLEFLDRHLPEQRKIIEEYIKIKDPNFKFV